MLAARRKTTLKAIRTVSEPENPGPARFEVGPFGILRIRKVPGSLPTTLAQVDAARDELEEEEFRRAIHPNRT